MARAPAQCCLEVSNMIMYAPSGSMWVSCIIIIVPSQIFRTHKYILRTSIPLTDGSDSERPSVLSPLPRSLSHHGN